MNISKNQKVWLVTGTSSGLGRSFVKAIVKNGDCVVVTARNKEAVLDLEILYPGQVMALDVIDQVQIKQVVQTVLKTIGHVDMLVNNAGYGYRAGIEEGIDEEVELLFRTNFYGPVALIKTVLPCMRQQKIGAIINISSVAAVNTFAGSGYYGASKRALEGISSALKMEKFIKDCGLPTKMEESPLQHMEGAVFPEQSARLRKCNRVRRSLRTVCPYPETAFLMHSGMQRNGLPD